MDKNQIIGFLLIGAILLGFVFLTKPNKAKQEEQQRIEDSLRRVQEKLYQEELAKINQKDSLNVDSIKNIIATDTTLNDSLVNKILVDKYGVFANSAIGEQEFITAKNDVMEIKISTKGAVVQSVNLTDYVCYDQSPLIMFEGEQNTFDLNFFVNQNLIHTNELFFVSNAENNFVDATKEEKKITFRANVTSDSYLEYVYTIKPNNYLVDFDINFVNLDKYIPSNTSFLELYWNEYLRHLERGEKWEKDNTFLFYKLYQAGVKSLKIKKNYVEEELTSKVQWVSYKQQFFTTTLIAKNHFDYAKISSEDLLDDTVNLKLMKSKITVPFTNTKNSNIALAFYYGPAKYSIMRKVKAGENKMQLEKMIPLGGSVLSWINKGLIIPLFNFLGKYIGNFGIIILVMTLIIKLVLFPLTYKSYASAAKMKILKPEVDKVVERFPKEKTVERQQATMDLYKKAGVNPLGGCLPTLLQFPFLFAMFRFFPASIELRQKSFLWVKDLSTYDAILSWEANIPVINWIFGNHVSLFTILMAVAMIFSTKLSNTNMDNSNPQAKTMQIMMYIMPLMMIVWFNSYSAGLSYYYFLSTLIGIIQTLLIRRFIDEEKVLSQLKEKIKNNKAPEKSNFQKRLEDLQKQRAMGNNPQKPNTTNIKYKKK